MRVSVNNEAQQTRKEERLQMQARHKIHAIGKEESDQGAEQITTSNVHVAVSENVAIRGSAK